MKTWKYRRRRPSEKTLRSADDKAFLATHHKRVTSKQAAKNEKQEVKRDKEMKIYKDKSAWVFSQDGGWKRGKCWFRKPGV